jgi:hypothetical protein
VIDKIHCTSFVSFDGAVLLVGMRRSAIYSGLWLYLLGVLLLKRVSFAMPMQGQR